MPRNTNNTRQCIECGSSVGRRILRCPPCAAVARRNRVPYERTPEIREKISKAHKGKPKPAGYVPASKRPEVAAKIAAYWTPERRAAKSQEQTALYDDHDYRVHHAEKTSGEQNPNWKHGQAATPYSPGWGRRVRKMAHERAGHQCEACGGRGRLDTHHKDFETDNHSLENLEVLCRKCHKQRHRSATHS